MPLRNRVDPFGKIHAVTARGLLMGNRGGCLHDANKQLTRRRWTSRRWIACVTAFKGRRRTVMTPGRYTELFFLDEATALAAGHRPCFECRRADANRFAEAWRRATGADARPSADEMDVVLHAERVVSGDGPRPISSNDADTLPDGCMVGTPDGEAWLIWEGSMSRWSHSGYAAQTAERLRADVGLVLITPPTIVDILRAGIPPRIHPSRARA